MSLFVLRLYVPGRDFDQGRTAGQVEEFCAKHLDGRYHLTIVDAGERPDLLAQDRILAMPTLVCESQANGRSAAPRAEMRVVGTIGDGRLLLNGLKIGET